MYDKVLLERNRYPEYKGEIVDGSGEIIEQELVNASCGDRLKVQLVVRDGVIVDGRWSGQGCAIAQVSADLMVGKLIGKTVTEARALKGWFEEMIYGGKKPSEQLEGGQRQGAGGVDEQDVGEGLGDLRVLECVARMPARGKCASLAWGVVEKLD